MRILILLIVLLLPVHSWASKCTSTASGNWSDNTIWDSACAATGVPGAGAFTNYSGIVAAGHTVALSDSRTIYATTVSGSLVQGDGVVTTLGGILTVGPTGSDGSFTFGAGSELQITAANTLTLGRAAVRSNATAGSWSKVTGTGGVINKSADSSPKQNILLRYVSFQNTGTILLAAGGNQGTLTSLLDVTNCAFVGTGAIIFGHGGWTPVTAHMRINNNDFRDVVGNITVDGHSSIPSGNSEFKNNTLSVAGVTKYLLYFNSRRGFILDGTIVAGYTSQGTTYKTQRNMLITWGAAQTAANLDWAIQTGDTFNNNYSYSPSNLSNPHIFSVGSNAAGTLNVDDNVMEMLMNPAGGNGGNGYMLMNTLPATLSINFNRNLNIGAGAAYNMVYISNQPVNVAINNATVAVTQTGTGTKPTTLWLTEGLPKVTGNLTIKNSIGAGLATSMDNFTLDNTATGTGQNFTTVDYNNLFNITTPHGWGATPGTVGGTTNNISVNPQFVDTSRSLANFNGNSTAAQSIAQFLAINGYSPTTKTQSDAPSNVTVPALLAYVRAGFVPTNMSLATAGEGGAYIGAITPAAAATSDSIFGLGFGL